MNAAVVSKGQRVDFQIGTTQMVNGEFVHEERIVSGVVVGFFKANRYIRVRQDGSPKSDTILLTPRYIVKAY